MHKARYVAIIVVGLMIVIFGILFYYQSISYIGPKQSFMYSNPTWTVNAYVILVIGLSIFSAGILLTLKK